MAITTRTGPKTPPMDAAAAQQVRPEVDPRSTIVLVAHNREQLRLVEIAVCYRDILSSHRLLVTGTTGRMLAEMVGLDVDRVRPGIAGGERKVADVVAGPRVVAVIFLVDALTRRPHEPGIEPVIKACSLRDIPLATNVATARAVLQAVAGLA